MGSKVERPIYSQCQHSEYGKPDETVNYERISEILAGIYAGQDSRDAKEAREQEKSDDEAAPKRRGRCDSSAVVKFFLLP